MGGQGSAGQWWEKTVEYAFVLQCLPKAAVIAPLSGAAETGVGDATLQIAQGYLLIEFKATRSKVLDELEKYERSRRSETHDLEAARKVRLQRYLAILGAMPGSDAHQLVFGRLEHWELKTMHVPYPRALDDSFEPDRLSRERVEQLPRRPHTEMLLYLAELRRLRGVESSGGSVVVGISAGRASLMTIEEFERSGPSSELSISHSADLSAINEAPYRPADPARPKGMRP